MADYTSTPSSQLADVPGMPTGNTIINQLSSARTNLISLMKGGQTSTMLFNSSPDIAKSSFNDTSGNFVDSNLVRNARTGNFSPDVPQNLSRYNSANNSSLSAFMVGSQGSASNPLTWVAGTTSKSINGIDLPTGIKNLTGLNTLMSSGQLAKLAGLGSEATSSIKNALKSVTGSLSELWSSGSSAMSAVQSGLREVKKNLVEPIRDLTTVAALATNPRALGQLAASNVDFLPKPLQTIVGNAVASQAKSILGGTNSKVLDLIRKVYAIDTLMSGSGGTAGSLNSLLAYNPYGYNSSYYPSLSGQGGSYVPGYSSYRGSEADYAQMTQAINQLCGKDTVKNNYTSYNANKSAYDLLMQYAMNTGAGQLVNALMGCAGSEYYDSRTSNMMYASSSNIANSGDAYTYRQVLQAGGVGNSRNPLGEMLGLYANTSYNASNQEDIDYIMRTQGYRPTDLVAGQQVGRYDVLDASKMTVLQQGDPAFYSQCANDEDYAAINVATLYYAD